MNKRRAVAEIMGTVISVAAPAEVPQPVFDRAVQAAFEVLREADEVFSPFLPDSPVSQIRDGRLRLAELADHPHGARIREVLATCAILKEASGGAFDAWRVGDPPGFDPSGAVKGWAADRASAALASHGLTSYALGAGGDVVLHGGPWRVGITDPHRRGEVLAVAEIESGAVATSGTVERGPHIWDPHTAEPARGPAQVTIIGPSLTWADGYATAAMAKGRDARPWLSDLSVRTGYQALVIEDDGGAWWTPGVPDHVPTLRDATASAG